MLLKLIICLIKIFFDNEFYYGNYNIVNYSYNIFYYREKNNKTILIIIIIINCSIYNFYYSKFVIILFTIDHISKNEN